MLGNYLVTALRNLERNRLYAAITVLGLAVAFTAAILIVQFVRTEFSYDTWIPGYQQVYKIGFLVEQPGRPATLFDQEGASFRSQIEQASPGRVAITRLIEDLPIVRRRAGAPEVSEQSFAWADPNVFRVFPLPVLAGDLQSALQEPDTVVITRRVARKYFGRDLPIGDTLQVQTTGDHFRALRVTAVLKDLPANTNLTTEIFASGRSAESVMSQAAAAPLGPARSGYTFVRLSPLASAARLQRALEIAHEPLTKAAKASWGATKVSTELISLPEAHFRVPSYPAPVVKPAGSRSVAYGAASVGALILLVAAINFVTLVTARAARRGVEVGIRKASGARRSDLMVQFVGEALLQVALSLVIGAALAEFLVGPFNALSQRGMALDFVHDPVLLAGVLGIGLGVGLLASIYPALVLSSFRPMAVLKGGAIPGGATPVARHTLVVVQFAVLVGLIVTTATLYRQTAFALVQGLGTVDANRIVSVFAPCDNAFAKEVRKLPGVAAVACSSPLALNLPSWQDATPVQIPGGRQMNFAWAQVDFGFFELYGVKPVAGRLYSPKYGEDAAKYTWGSAAMPPVIINQTGARALGFADPRKAVGQRFINFYNSYQGKAWKASQHSSVIVGVVPDMPMNVRTATEPTYYYILPNQLNVLSIRMTGEDIPRTIKAIEATWKRTGNAKPIDEVFLAQARQAANLDLVIQRVIVAVGAGLAALIACLGLFALSAYTTERRTKEIGVRKVMGADTVQVVLLLLWQFTIPVLVATAIAIPVGFVAMDWWLHGFTYHVPLSPWTFILAVVAAVGIAWLTVSWQSFIVARAKPVSALRYE